MARDSLTGSRIRERRLVAGLRQTDLAKACGISASYLNLIEHNRRRIGGKLLVAIAQALGVEPSALTEGAEAALVATLREAAAEATMAPDESARAEEFVGRFPGWARALARAHRRLTTLERAVETLSDRLTHDPHLAGSLHELLSTAAAIRSTASILAETGELEPEWRDRFHRNLNQDSRRLADSSKALVAYLDDTGSAMERRGEPREEAEAFLAARNHRLPELESGSATPAELVEGAGELTSRAARQIAIQMLEQCAADARALPFERFAEAVARLGADPGRLATETGAELPRIFRRLAAMPEEALPGGAGLVICDASGAPLFRKPVGGFAMPRFGVPCPLWPLFLALTRPLVPVRRRLVQAGRAGERFDCIAIAWPEGAPALDADPMFRATMLILPVRDAASAAPVQEVGSTCRLCPRSDCAARREPSILRGDLGL